MPLFHIVRVAAATRRLAGVAAIVCVALALAGGCEDERTHSPADVGLDAVVADAGDALDGQDDTSFDTGSDAVSDTPAVDVPRDAPDDALVDVALDTHSDGGDTSSDAQDARDGSPDADVPPTVDPDANVIPNWDFEEWQDGLPVGWFGPESNIPSGSVSDDTTDPHSNAHACGLANESSTHKRFTTSPFALPAGRYLCAYQVRGTGEVRGGFYGLTNYHYGSYDTVDSTAWRELTYTFNLATDTDDFALIFSVRNTVAPQHLSIDYVVCNRLPHPCDTVVCDEWAVCNPQSLTCEAQFGRCGDAADCMAWEQCGAGNVCELAAGRCYGTEDCEVAGTTPVCEATSHTCVAGDPCAGVICDGWKACNPANARCVLSAGRCDTTLDCVDSLPACDGATHTCESADHAANIFPNGGFELWSDWDVPYFGVHTLPDAWYGLFDDLTDATGASELDPAALLPYTTKPHSGANGLEVVQTVALHADRFASEDFDIPTGSYTCVYWVRGKGSVRHRGYSTGGWAPLTPFVDIDSDTWLQMPFTVPGNVRNYRLIFTISNTDPSRDHLQLDDVVCTAN